MEKSYGELDTNEEQFTCAMQLVTTSSLTMVLVTSIKLKILEAIAKAGPDAQLSANELTSRLFKLQNCVLEGGIPFDKVRGMNTFELPAVNARFNEMFNKAMGEHSTISIKEVLNRYHEFDKLKRVVDVGGGLGVAMNMIVSKYPHIQGINYDLPHVIKHASVLYPGIEHVSGDMFQYVPEGDAIFLKWILHDWSDEHCVILLKNCYKALRHDGKVIVVDAILPFLPQTSTCAQVNMKIDALMMTQDPGGRERTDDEFQALATSAGFRGIRKKCVVYNFCVMEFYK